MPQVGRPRRGADGIVEPLRVVELPGVLVEDAGKGRLGQQPLLVERRPIENEGLSVRPKPSRLLPGPRRELGQGPGVAAEAGEVHQAGQIRLTPGPERPHHLSPEAAAPQAVQARLGGQSGELVPEGDAVVGDREHAQRLGLGERVDLTV